MRTPGFTADASLDRIRRAPRPARAGTDARTGRVIPAAISGVYQIDGTLYCCDPCGTYPDGSTKHCCNDCGTGSIPASGRVTVVETYS
jgi:hypothetical protein